MGFKLIYRKYKKNVFSTTCKQSFVDGVWQSCQQLTNVRDALRSYPEIPSIYVNVWGLA